MSKSKQTDKKGEKAEGAGKVEASQAPQSVAEVFSLSRDIEVLHPYHLDGDVQMYSEEKMEARERLKNDPEIVKELNEVILLLDR